MWVGVGFVLRLVICDGIQTVQIFGTLTLSGYLALYGVVLSDNYFLYYLAGVVLKGLSSNGTLNCVEVMIFLR